MRRLKIVFFAVLLPLALLGLGAGALILRSRSKPNPIRTTEVERGELVLSVRETGFVEPIRSVAVKSKVAGLVSRLAVEDGDRVEKGQLVARLDVPELEAQRDQVKAQLDGTRARLEQARLSLARDRELTESQVRQAQAGLRVAQVASQEAGTRRRDAERVYTNKERLFKGGGYVSQSDLDSAKSSLELALQAEESARERVREQEAGLAAASARRVEVDLSRSRIAEAEASLRQIRDSLAEIESRLEDAVIRAPCSGVIMARHVREGELITAVSYYGSGAPIVTIGDLTTMLVKVDLNEVDIDKVRPGQSVQIAADALPGRVYRGRVTQISPVSLSAAEKPGIVRFPVEVTIDRPYVGLKPGMTADVEITCRRAEGVLRVPNDAVFEKEGKPHVAVVSGEARGKPTVTDREVTTGLSNEAYTEVRSGLKEGERVQLGRSALPERKKLELFQHGSEEED